MSEKKIILASGSPRRKELMTQIGMTFEVRVSDVEENATAEKPEDLVMELSKCKALAVFQKMPLEEQEESIVIGSDTVVSVDGKILGKPENKSNAIEMLKMIQGRSHQVYTGVTFVKSGVLDSFFEKTDVIVYPMSDEEIENYVESENPMDKAGSYGIQGIFAKHIQGIVGDYNNVVGLPIGRLYQELQNF